MSEETDPRLTWLLEQIAEDGRIVEEVAAEARGASWQAEGCEQCAGHILADATVPEHERTVVECQWHEGGGLYVDPSHMVRWDPARALVECEAKRRIARRHEPIPVTDDHGRRWIACRCCGYGGAWPVAWPCDTVQDVASAYVGQPGYRAEEWRPDTPAGPT
jgi:hypothetical protein